MAREQVVQLDRCERVVIPETSPAQHFAVVAEPARGALLAAVIAKGGGYGMAKGMVAEVAIERGLHLLQVPVGEHVPVHGAGRADEIPVHRRPADSALTHAPIVGGPKVNPPLQLHFCQPRCIAHIARQRKPQSIIFPATPACST
jgi:hypothetical protein